MDERLLSDAAIDCLLGWAFGGVRGPGWLETPARAGTMVRVAIPNRPLSSTDMLAYELCELYANAIAEVSERVARVPGAAWVLPATLAPNAGES